MDPLQIQLTVCLLLAWLVTLLPMPGGSRPAYATERVNDQLDADEVGTLFQAATRQPPIHGDLGG